MKRTIFFLFLACILIATSCIPIEKLKYTQKDSTAANDFYSDRSEKTIQPYDYLYIKIYSLNEQTSSIFATDSRFNQSEQLISYEVNDAGYISFPFIGNIYVKDLTISEAKEKIEKSLNQYLTNISVRVRFVGNKITVLGEVNRPGNYTFYDEKITVFQAIGLASDASAYGDKTSVTLIREKDNNVKYHYLDLSNKNIVTSDYYYLLPNDVLIVDPVKAKYRNMRDYSMFYVITSSLSSMIAIVSLIYAVK